jgi:hypothetical protein
MFKLVVAGTAAGAVAEWMLVLMPGVGDSNGGASLGVDAGVSAVGGHN